MKSMWRSGLNMLRGRHLMAQFAVMPDLRAHIRLGLFRTLRGLLKPGGRFAMVSSMQGMAPLSTDFELILRSTQECAPLPRVGELKGQLEAAGFSSVEVRRLVPIEPFYGVIARRIG